MKVREFLTWSMRCLLGYGVGTVLGVTQPSSPTPEAPQPITDWLKRELAAPIDTTEPQAVRYIFKVGADGSFNDPATDSSFSGGTTGSAVFPAVRAFSAEGKLLSETPSWIKSMGVRLTGSGTPAACARFALATERTSALCDWDQNNAGTSPCGASAGYYRVSEWDCTNGVVANGTGAGTDPAAIRVEIDREVMGSGENLLVTLEYRASAVAEGTSNATGGSLDPTRCNDSSTAFDSDNSDCADMTWRLYLKNLPTDPGSSGVLPPYLVVPPFSGRVNPELNSGGGAWMTRSFLIPLKNAPDITTLQFTRVQGRNPDDYKDSAISTNNRSICRGTNTAECLGIIFKSITLVRLP